MDILFLVIKYTTAIVFFLCAISLFLKRKEGERSRTILAYILLLSVIVFLCSGVLFLFGFELLPCSSTRMALLSFFMVSTYTFYPIEVITPGWLNFNRVMWIYTPVIVLTFTHLISLQFGVEHRHVDSLDDFLANIHYFHYYFKAIIYVFIVMISLVVLMVPYSKRIMNVDKIWIVTYLVLVEIKTLTYIGVLVIQAPAINALFYVAMGGFVLYITYQELFIRLFIPTIHAKSFAPQISEEAPALCSSPLHLNGKVTEIHQNVPYSAHKNDNKSIQMLVYRLDKYMTQEHPWINPDISVSSLSKELNTNRTFLSKAIKEEGFESFYDFIAHYRIQEFCRQVELNQDLNMKVIFYNVGFRSRSSAFSQFKKQMNMTPGDYMKNIAQKSHQHNPNS